MAASKKELIREYTKAIRAGNAAVFAGAGLSRSSGLVDWKELLRPLADEIGLDVDKETNLLTVAQYYKDSRNNRGGVNQAILDAFSKDAVPNDNIKILSRLPIGTYWTTNYDHLIEDVIKGAERTADVKIYTRQLSKIKPGRDCIVYKMHGDVNDPDEAVLTREDYETYDKKRRLFSTALQGDLISKIFLFIGFSFEDPNLMYMLGKIHSLLEESIHDHYCIFKKVSLNDCDNGEEFAYKTAKQEMQIENLTHYGIQSVLVDEYSEITDILKDVETNLKRANIFISGSANEYTTPWNEATANKFAEKLSETLVHSGYRITTGFGLGIGSSIINGALNVIYSEKNQHIGEHLCMRPFPQNVKPEERQAKWKKYREDMLHDTGIAVFMFGNKWKENSKEEVVNANGCWSEYEIAKEEKNLIIPIGSTGYMAREIYDDVREHIDDYPYLQDYIDELGSETDIEKLVSLVVKIISDQRVV